MIPSSLHDDPPAGMLALGESLRPFSELKGSMTAASKFAALGESLRPFCELKGLTAASKFALGESLTRSPELRESITGMSKLGESMGIKSVAIERSESETAVTGSATRVGSLVNVELRESKLVEPVATERSGS